MERVGQNHGGDRTKPKLLAEVAALLRTGGKESYTVQLW
jgi:hypothetical protein